MPFTTFPGVEYSIDKSFSKKKRKNGKKYKQPVPQFLRDFNEQEWNDPRCKLTVAEKQFFYKKECWSQSGKPYFRYTFSEPWRYVLQVRPNMITHKKTIDEELLSRKKQLNNHITTHYLRHKIDRLIYGRSKWRIRRWEKDPRSVNPFINKPVHLILQEARNEKIQSWTRY